MISSDDALKIILENSMSLPISKVPIRESLGMVLAEDILADRDFPPFDRVTMDGIAILSKSWDDGVREFKVQGIQAAGEPRTLLLDPNNAIEIMTGAVLPEKTDTVIKVEELAFNEEGGSRTVTMESVQVQVNKNVHKKGSDHRAGDVLIRKGDIIRSPEIGVLATVGKSVVHVVENPKVAIISTGDELVDVNETPLSHQIRRSNVLGIQAELDQMGIYSETFHLLDDKDQLILEIENIFSSFPVVILSGGVSKGKFDYVPEVMEQLGVKKLFHRITQRPGKPFWFGKSNNNFVFALPGNPVSTFMCFIRYVKLWLLKIQGQHQEEVEAFLTQDFNFKPNLTYFLQVRLGTTGGQLSATPVIGNGSGDHVNLVDADGFLELPMDIEKFSKGEKFKLFLYRPLV